MNPVTEIGVFQIGSRLIPRDVVKSKPGELASALRAINEQASSWISGLAFNVSRTPAFPNAVHPAWRDAALSIVIGTYVPAHTAETCADLLVTDSTTTLITMSTFRTSDS